MNHNEYTKLTDIKTLGAVLTLNQEPWTHVSGQFLLHYSAKMRTVTMMAAMRRMSTGVKVSAN